MTALHEKHFPALDGLRGVAALMIVALHSSQSYWISNTFDKAYLRAVSPLWIGVDLFFVLSGFLITRILLDTRNSPHYLRTFYGRRILRIFPLYYGFLIVFYFLLPHLGYTLTPAEANAEPWQWTYLANIYGSFHTLPGPNIGQFWSLGIEEQFYFVWPLIVLLTSAKMLKRGIVVAVCSMPFIRAGCIAGGLPNGFIICFTLCRLDGLLLGALLAIATREGLLQQLASPQKRKAKRTLDSVAVGLASTFVIVYYFILGNSEFVFDMHWWPWYLQSLGFLLISVSLGYAVLRLLSPTLNPFQRILSLKPLRTVGKYSYALYVLHAPICHWVGASFPVPSFLQDLPPAWSAAHSIYLIAVEFSLSIAAAVISWHVLEKHFLKLKKYFPYRSRFSSHMEPELAVS